MPGTPEGPSTDYVTSIADSRRWRHFRPRAGDIVVVTPPKSGTTWAQAILAMLIAGDPGVDAETSMKSPWIDITIRDIGEVVARLEAQDHRRQVKSHTPFDGIPVWPGLRYIAVYRHPVDVFFSFRKHAENMKMALSDHEIIADPREAFRLYIGDDPDRAPGFLLRAVVNHYRSALALEGRENLLRLHYADMTRDLTGAVAGIAAHVGIEHPPELMARIVEAATFDSMKANAGRFTPSAGQGFWHRDDGFFESATSQKWVGVLTEDDLAAYDAAISALLAPEERRWLEWGSV